MKPSGVTEKQIRLRDFPFSLKDAAKDWLYYLSAGNITTWAQLKKKFLEKFFPASRAASLRKEICSIKQYPGESLYDYCKRFNKLYTRCPQHQISEQLLIQYFYKGLQSSGRSIIDAASEGALANKTPREAWELIEAMAKNSQQFGFRETVGNMQRANVCGVCTSMDHSTNACLILQRDGAEHVNLAGGVSAPRKQYEPYSNTYNPSWRDHPNFNYGNRQQNSFENRSPRFQQPWQPKPQPPSTDSGDSLADIIKNLAIKDMETPMSQMATAINRLESHDFGKLLSQSETNLKNGSAMTLRSGKEVEGPKLANPKGKSEEKIEKKIEDEGHI
ncbi:uncharacterized protein LOC113777214 [Coffea eugenioides]|uniref:uncharacterized protein LOC113777214 n=1 Tax=Coffea eugenioides TaxID=49369 RepID=UPI000F609BB4|nr:uncharacterized protein LOC113777214 [Coffea eugenioides]